jgi:hypothetical protein
MGTSFTGRDVFAWKVISNRGEIMKYPADFEESRKRGKPMNDLDGFRAANQLARLYGGFAVRV